MQFKPFTVFVGYNTDCLEYLNGKAGMVPRQAVIEWLDEIVGRNCWQFDWQKPVENLPVSYSSDLTATLVSIDHQMKTSGGTFYFDSEEDRLLFCLRYVSNNDYKSIMWHPV